MWHGRAPTWFPDTTHPPPSVPSGMGSAMYPRQAISYNRAEKLDRQVRMESLNRQRQEKWRLEQNKGPYYEEFRRAHQHLVKNYCETCSEASEDHGGMTVVNHQHFSTLSWRVSQRANRYGEILCPGCQKIHSMKEGMRIPILLTSSTLANWRGKVDANRYQGDTIHMDSIEIPGAKIRDLQRAFLAEYKGSHRPVDIVAVVGLNDVNAGHSPERVLRDARALRDAVLSIPNSSCAFATLPYPPKFTALNDDNRRKCRDLTSTLAEVNLGFAAVNLEVRQPVDVRRVPKLHTFGTKGTRPATQHPRDWMSSRPRHRPAGWREAKPAHQLHLADKDRLRAGKCVVKYFTAIYGMLPNRKDKWNTK